MENSNSIDVSYTELKDDIYYTAVQVAEILNEPVTTIRGWAKDESFGDLLELKRENGRRKYTKKDIENLKFIKELIDKKYSYSQIREIISKRGFSFGEYDSGLINPNDPLGFEALAIKITQKQDEKLKLMQKHILDILKEFMEVYAEAQNEKLNFALDDFNESLDLKLEKQEKSIKKIINEIELDQQNRDKEFLDKLNSDLDNKILNKNESEEQLKIKIDSLNNGIKEIKESINFAVVTKEDIEKANDKKSWFSKIFK